jgi:CheY-like chemotaxis protein
VLVVEPSPRLLERMTTSLREAGFSVEGAFDGADACTACLERPPDIALVADEMPGVDGWTVAQTIRSRPRLCDTLVLLTSESPDDVMRLRAYHLGVAEILPKPFTEEELGLRMARLAMLANRRETGRVILRGSLSDLRVHSLLTLLDFEQKTGIVMACGPTGTARIFVSHGRVVRVDAAGRTDGAFAALREILDWEDGSFELVAAEVSATPELDMSTAAILIEHERLKDEAR